MGSPAQGLQLVLIGRVAEQRLRALATCKVRIATFPGRCGRTGYTECSSLRGCGVARATHPCDSCRVFSSMICTAR